MSVSRRIVELFEAGYKPADLVRMGYPKSTVYTVYKRWLEGKAGGGFIYLAHDIDYRVVERFSGQLSLLGYKVVVGGNTQETLTLVRPARVVVGLAGRHPGFRRPLLLEELREASRLMKPTYVFAERGASLPAYRGVRVLELDRENPRKMAEKLASEAWRSEGLRDVIAGIILGVLVALGVVAVAKLLEEILG